MLEVGMEVEFEVNTDGQPRWAYKETNPGIFVLIDKGYSGEFVRGSVVNITSKVSIAHIEYNHPTNGTLINYSIALDGHHAYDKCQWITPGFPIPVKKQAPRIVCTCGSWAVYGKMTCPGHAPRCDLYKPNPYTGL